MEELEIKKILDIKKMLRDWIKENENRVNDYPRKITQKRYVEEGIRLNNIMQIINILEKEVKKQEEED